MKQKIKLRDLTEKQYETWLAKNCHYTKCVNCPFRKVYCDFLSKNNWFSNKDLYSDKFLNKEIVIEIDLLTKEEKEYLEGVIKPFKDEIEYITKYYKDEYNPKEYIYLSIKDAFPTCLPEFEANKYYKGLERTKRYTLKDLGLFKE